MASTHPYLAAALPRAFAHRGWHLDELSDMENSLSAFRRAAYEGYHYIETDVHSTRDGVLVIHHDQYLDRTTDGTGPIARQTWADVRRAKIAGRERVSRLEDVLEELPETAFNIDVKADDAVDVLVRTIERTAAYDRVGIASFSERRLGRLRRLAGPRLLTALGPRSAGLLRATSWPPPLPRLGRLNGLISGAMAQVPVRLGRMAIVDRAFIRAAKHAGIEVHPWTVDRPAHMRALLSLGVHGIVTDRPDLLRDVLIERGVWPQRPFA